MSLLKRLFGRTPAEPVFEDYKDCRIFAEPMAEGSKFRLAARIEKEINGEAKIHQVIRADIFEDQEQANAASLAKAKQVIDEQGKFLFSD